MQKKSLKDINFSFRFLYILAIFMILDGHIGSFNYLSLEGLFPYQNYHIALFAFASGYFLNLAYDYKNFISHKFMRLILTLYLWNIIYGGLVYLLNHHYQFSLGDDFSLYTLFYAPIVDGHQYIYNMGSWFLIPLFFVQLISFVILKPLFSQKNNSTLLLICFFCFSLLLGCISLRISPENFGQRNILLTGCRIFYFLPFYALGILYRNFLEQHDTLNAPVYFSLIIFATILLRFHFPESNIIPAWLDWVNAPSWSIYAVSFLAIGFWLRVAKIFAPIMKESRILNYVSTHTFDIMMHHFIGFMFVKAILSPFGIFDKTAFKTNIWYYHFPFGEVLSTPIYIIITLVIALFIGFTGRKFCYILTKRLSFLKKEEH